MERFEYLPSLYRDQEGRIQSLPYPRKEPSQDELTADVYAASYGVVKGLFGPPRLRDLDVVIFNTRAYQPDPELEEEAKVRLLRAIRDKEGAALIDACGGEATIRSQITVDTWFAEEGRR